MVNRATAKAEKAERMKMPGENLGGVSAFGPYFDEDFIVYSGEDEHQEGVEVFLQRPELSPKKILEGLGQVILFPVGEDRGDDGQQGEDDPQHHQGQKPFSPLVPA